MDDYKTGEKRGTIGFISGNYPCFLNCYLQNECQLYSFVLSGDINIISIFSQD